MILGFLFAIVGVGASEAFVREQPQPGDFALIANGHAATIVVAPGDFKVVQIAARDLANDIERVTGAKPELRDAVGAESGPLVLAGTLGHSPAIDALVASGKLDVVALRGQWETFLLATVADVPVAGVTSLAIVGSDRRGTAFGLYELSQAIGVSPWQWWADVAPTKKSELFVAAGTRKFGPPSVQYRGIFINDEDWGLQPWAAKTFAPEDGGIGPKTYTKVFELLLRLKANTLWPAMHECTKPFNADPRNAALADDYAIVMGSSHAEPMLRNNVGEWTAPHEQYDYVHNRDGVRKYWEERARTNGRYENIYTLGMRGIHDSGMVGPKTDAERIATLTQIFADQRELLARHVNPNIEQVPQMFCAYKEVLDLYRQGLKVPDDVTIMWPDDNHGYIRNYPNSEERKRAGGFGIYYHVSYLGRPLSYLWLCSTPPSLIWEEMSKAYEHGARRMWILNVGDIKPAEIATEFFLRLAWNINSGGRERQPEFLREWAAREFGAEHADRIAEVINEYYRLNYARKPEHLQWWLPGKTPVPSPWSDKEVEERAYQMAQNASRAQFWLRHLPSEKHDSFFQLVYYPVMGSFLANGRYLFGESGQLHAAQAADAKLKELTRGFNEDIAGGKWRGIMTLEPADTQWKSMRIAPWTPPKFSADAKPAAPAWRIKVAADKFSVRVDRVAAWREIVGLGRDGAAMALLPTTATYVDMSQAAERAPSLAYTVQVPAAGAVELRIHVLPTHSLEPGRGLRLAVALDAEPIQPINLSPQDGTAEWSQAVLDARRTARINLSIAQAGSHTLRIYGLEPGVVLESLELAPAPNN